MKHATHPDDQIMRIVTWTIALGILGLISIGLIVAVKMGPPSKPIQAAASVEPTPPAQTSPVFERADVTEQPAAPTRLMVPGSSLSPSVQGFLRQVAPESSIRDIASRFYDAGAAAAFAKQVEHLTEDIRLATEIYDQEVERAKAAAMRDVVYYRAEEDYLRAIRMPESDGTFRIGVEADGSWGLITLSLAGQPALQQAKQYLESFEEWRSVLRGRAAGLLATSTEKEFR